MIKLNQFHGACLHGGFMIVGIRTTDEPLLDAIGREAIARTRIIGGQFDLLIAVDLSQRELSVTLYHEVLEAATVAAHNPPAAVREFNEGDFERAAYDAHERFGDVSPQNLDRMLQLYGF